MNSFPPPGLTVRAVSSRCVIALRILQLKILTLVFLCMISHRYVTLLQVYKSNESNIILNIILYLFSGLLNK